MTAIHFNAGTGWQAAPIEPTWIIDGTPRTEMNPIAGHKGTCSGFWRCTAGRFYWHYSVTEAVYIIAGAVTIRDTQNAIWNHLYPGDSALFPKGSSAEWIVDRYVQKYYVIHRSFSRRVVDRLKEFNSTKRGLM